MRPGKSGVFEGNKHVMNNIENGTEVAPEIVIYKKDNGKGSQKKKIVLMTEENGKYSTTN